ncbi:MAG: VCBS repeat-containing protein, partial [Gammaproteobacteria bacterium]|nr:VCBS repeat-containing protein [Gammaproteobacteria bacterium]
GSFKNPYAKIMEGYTALGAAVAVDDFDGDGWEDVFVTDSSEGGRNLLYRNRGDFTFEEVAAKVGLPSGNDADNASADACGRSGAAATAEAGHRLGPARHIAHSRRCGPQGRPVADPHRRLRLRLLSGRREGRTGSPGAAGGPRSHCRSLRRLGK